MIVIRDAAVDDAEAIATAHVAAWRTGYRGIFADEFLDGVEFERSRHDGWSERLRIGPPDNGNVLNRILVPVIDGRVVGFGHVGDENVGERERSGRGEIYGFYLHPDVCGSGAAALLVEACEASLAEHFQRAVLWTQLATPRSRRFYEKVGWTCGDGDEVVTDTWDLTGEPVTVVQYRRSFG